MPVDDIYSVLLAHADGPDGSTSFVDEAGHTITAIGSAQIDTAQSVFGGASALFPGAGAYLSVPDSDDWWLDDGSNANAWTIDFRTRFSTAGGDHGFFGQYVDGNNFWRFVRNSTTGGVQFRQKIGGVNTIDVDWTWSNAANTWYHVGLVKQGTTGYKFFVDGAQLGSTLTDVTPLENLAAPLLIGYSVGYQMTGWKDEIRISKGVARWTSGFTPSGSAYGPSAGSSMFRRGLDGVSRFGLRGVG